MTNRLATRNLDGIPSNTRQFDVYEEIAADLNCEIISLANKGDLSARTHILHSERFELVMDNFDIDHGAARKALVDRWRELDNKGMLGGSIAKTLAPIDEQGRMTVLALSQKFKIRIQSIYTLIYAKRVKTHYEHIKTPRGIRKVARILPSDLKKAYNSLNHFKDRKKI